MTYVGALEIIQCARCAIGFAAPERFITERRRDGKDFWCPAGHPNVYRKTTEDRLRDELKAKEARLQRVARERDHAEFSRRAEKAAKTRLKRRIANGVCPCCHRSFADVRRHMESKHPGYGGEED